MRNLTDDEVTTIAVLHGLDWQEWPGDMEFIGGTFNSLSTSVTDGRRYAPDLRAAAVLYLEERGINVNDLTI